MTDKKEFKDKVCQFCMNYYECRIHVDTWEGQIKICQEKMEETGTKEW